jgi:hypothetical protein
MSQYKDDNPEVFWCPICGKNVWIIATPTTTERDLVCEDCIPKLREKDLISKKELRRS